MTTRVDLDRYAQHAASGMLHSLAYYGNRCPAVGDGRVSTPAYYANALGRVLNARGDTLPGEPDQWWGTRWAIYAKHLLKSDLPTCRACSGPTTYAFDTTHNYLRCRTCGRVTPNPLALGGDIA